MAGRIESEYIRRVRDYVSPGVVEWESVVCGVA